MNKKLIGAFLALAVLLGGVRIVSAQGFTPDGFWKRVGAALLPIRATDTIGSSAQRIPTVYATNLDGVNLIINGSAPGGITLPWVDATSTSRASNIQRLIVGNSTTTNATTTNQFVSSLFATSGNIPLLTSAGINFGNATGTGNLFVGSVSSTYATSTDMVINRNLTVSAISGSGLLTIGQVTISPTQIISSYAGSAFITAGYYRSSAGIYAGNPTMFDNSDPTRGLGWDASLGLLYGRNGTNYWSMSKIVDGHSTTTMTTDIFKEGRNASTTIWYVGAGDGCSKVQQISSSTAPTYTPAPAANCN